MRLAVKVALAALLAGPASALAQPQGEAPAQPAAVCAAVDAALPAELAACTAKTGLAAGASAGGLAKAGLAVGHTVTATLPTTGDVTYLAQPDKPGGAASHGGLFSLAIAEAGTYRIALGGASWIDVLRDGKPVVSSAHSHGPACSTIRKIVDFPLQPGRYVVQISANADAALAILVARKP